MLFRVMIAMVAGWLQRHQHQVVTSLYEENRVLKAQLDGRRRLAALAHPIGRMRLREMATIATSDTLMRWYHRLIAQQFDGSRHHCRLGRPRVIEGIEPLVVRMVEENPRWGYRLIQGALAKLGYQIDAITVRNIRHRHHIGPARRRRQTGMSWAQPLRLHWEVLAATDFFTVEVATWPGLVTDDVLVLMELELSTHRVHLAGMTPYPTDAFMAHCARQSTAPIDGFLLGKRHLIHDCDTKFLHGFDRILCASQVEPVVLPPRSPNLNASCERFVRSIKEEALQQMIVIGETSIRSVIQSYLAHYPHERHQQGLGNQLLITEPGMEHQRGLVVRRAHHGGLLSYYHREAA